MVASYRLSRAGLEVYTTTAQNSSSTSNIEDNYTLQTGITTQIDYISEIYSDNFEYDYSDISSNASVSLPIEYLNYFFKGKKVALKKAWQEGDHLKWGEMELAVTGFVSEISYACDKVEIKIKGMDVLLDKEKSFDFKQTKRSEIIKKIIESSGLKAEINVQGLDDDVIDFTTTSSSSSKSNVKIKSTGSATIDEAVQKAIEGETDDLSKAKSIDKSFKEHVYYDYYWNCKFSDIGKAWEYAHLNCADGANVLCAMFISAGLTAVIVHTSGHYIVKLTIKGKIYYTDNAASTGAHTSRPFGEVWRDITSGSEVGTKIEV